MKTIVLNTFSSFATFPMFNPAYIKGLLCREGIDNIHIDVNQITWNSLLEEEFLAKLSFNEAVLILHFLILLSHQIRNLN